MRKQHTIMINFHFLQSTALIYLQSVMSLLLGGFDYGEIEATKPILGPLWFVLIMLFGVMYIMNVFLSIIMETYAEVGCLYDIICKLKTQ